MKKIFLPLLTLALVLVTMASCSSNDDNGDNGGGDTPSGDTYHGVCVFIGDDMADLGSYSVQVTDGTKTSTYDVVKQGKHGTYSYTFLDQPVSVTGYMLDIVEATTNDLSATVTYTANDKAKALTANDKVDICYFCDKGKNTSSSIKYGSSIRMNKGVYGDHAVEGIDMAITSINSDLK